MKSGIGRWLALVALAMLFPAAAHAQYLFWTETSFPAPTVNRSTTGGTSVMYHWLPPGSLPEGIAVDTPHLKIYWVESAYSGARIMRSSLDFSDLTPVVSGLSCLRGVAVDPTGGKLYWTSSNLITGARIQRANLDGSSIETLVSLSTLANPRGVELDLPNGKMYWADFDRRLVQRANLNGTVVETVLDSLTLGASPYDLAISGSAMFWTDWTGNIKGRLISGGSVVTVATGLGQPTFLAMNDAGNTMYWIEATAGAQRLRSLVSGGSPITLPPTIAAYGGIAYTSANLVDVPDRPAPLSFALERVAPNPTRGPAHFAFVLPRESRVELTVLDLQGRVVARLADGVLPAGRHEIEWTGAALSRATGVYFVRLRAGGEERRERFVFLR